MRIYLDTMVWIYALEGNASFGPAAQDTLRAIRSNQHTLLTSHFLLAELLVAPVKKGDAFTVAQYRRMLTAASVEVIPFTADVAVHFAKLRAQFRTKAADSIHLALAASVSTDMFITGDTDLNEVRLDGIKLVVGLNDRKL
jgi:predicted nucleic acid-binding protein